MHNHEKFALALRPPGAVEKAESGAKRVLEGMVADAMTLARKRTENDARRTKAIEDLRRLIRKAADDGIFDPKLGDVWLIALLYQSIGSKDLQSPHGLKLKGENYYFGRGVQADYTEAFKWFQKAAEQGDAGGQGWLGVCYSRGEGVPQDSGEAVQWFRKAAERGDTHAQNALGNCYANGYGVPQNLERAFRWYRIASEWDHTAKSKLYLGMCYLRGEGVAKDSVQAYKWLKLAAERDFPEAKEQLAALAASMSAAALADGEKAYEDYKSANGRRKRQ